MNEDDLHVVELAFDEELSDDDLMKVIGGVLQDAEPKTPFDLLKQEDKPKRP